MTSNKYIADLLKPRIKVMKDWPGRKDFEVGQIITLDKKFVDGSPMWEIEDCQGVRTYIMAFFEMFPAEFKKLQWWEDRENELAGTFIRAGDLDKRHTCYKLIEKLPDCEIWKMVCDDREHHYPLNGNITPITETEYLNYINSKK